MIKRFAITCLVASAGACLAQEAQNDIFDKMIQHYSGLEGCTVTLGFEMHSDQPGMADMLAAMKQTNPGYAVKPNEFAFWNGKKKPDAPGGMAVPLPSLYCNGQQLIAAVESMSVYTLEEAPESFNALLESGADEPNAPWKMLPGAQFVLALMTSEPRESLGTFMGDVEYKGVEGEAGEACHVLATTQKEPGGEETKLEMRIKAEGEPWLVSVTPDLSGSGAPPGFEVVMTFKDWMPAAEAPDEGQIIPQQGWEKVDNLADAVLQKMRGPAGAREETSEAGPMANTPAPAFALPLLKGGEFSLAEHKGKVIVLDFWATWCGPCIRGLPTVTKVTGEYAPKGVVFAAINLQEEADRVSGFMENKSWDFTVALDADGSVANQFGVSAIPHSVIIDKKGVIRHVHVGFDPATYEQELRGELDSLLAE